MLQKHSWSRMDPAQTLRLIIKVVSLCNFLLRRGWIETRFFCVFWSVFHHEFLELVSDQFLKVTSQKLLFLRLANDWHLIPQNLEDRVSIWQKLSFSLSNSSLSFNCCQRPFLCNNWHSASYWVFPPFWYPVLPLLFYVFTSLNWQLVQETYRAWK